MSEKKMKNLTSSTPDYDEIFNQRKKLKRRITMSEQVFKVPVIFSATGYVEVEATNRKELMQKLQNQAFVDALSLPSDWEYLDDSYAIDFEGID